MQAAALIVAAGMSSRMGEFKPMMNIGSISVSQRIIATLHQAGIEKIVMVTGFKAVTLERHLAGKGIVFLRNEQYENTQMFDSAKIGLSYLRDKCERVLFMPVDVPLFTAATVRRILASRADLVCPECEGRRGHPVMLNSHLIPRILEDWGEGGLRGAMERCEEEITSVTVNDPGILHDVDTPEDFSALLAYHNSQLVHPGIQVTLRREKPFLDSKTAMLLTLVEETKSVRAAGQRMQLSYSSCWNIIRVLESQLSFPMIVRSQGGAGGSSSLLTPQGKDLLDRYYRYEQALKDRASELFESYFGEIFL